MRVTLSKAWVPSCPKLYLMLLLRMAAFSGGTASGQPFLIVDEFQAVCESMLRHHQKGAEGSKGARIDIILDNTGGKATFMTRCSVGLACTANVLSSTGVEGKQP